MRHVTMFVAVLCTALSGCATTSQCELLAVAYNETDELAGAWYDEVAPLIGECGFVPAHTKGCRGVDPDGWHNQDKKRCGGDK